MKAITTLSLCGFSLAAGVVAALWAAPLFHQHGDPTEHLQAMWAEHYPSLADMSNDVDAVVVAKVVQTVPGRVVTFQDGRPGLPFTYVDLEVSKVLRGDAPTYLTLEQTGGELNGHQLFFDDDGGAYRAGDSVLLFLKVQPETGLYYVAHPAGRFRVREDKLEATLPTHPAAQALDQRSLGAAERLILG